MKLAPIHRIRLYSLLDEIVEEHGRGALNEYRFHTSGSDPDERFRWNLFWLIDPDFRDELLHDIYRYANDSHIDTALRQYVTKHVYN